MRRSDIALALNSFSRKSAELRRLRVGRDSSSDQLSRMDEATRCYTCRVPRTGSLLAIPANKLFSAFGDDTMAPPRRSEGADETRTGIRSEK